jgi:hypothetical protein
MAILRVPVYVMSRGLEICQRFGETYRLYLQGRKVSESTGLARG